MVIVTSNMSVAVALPTLTGVSRAEASTTISAGSVSTGAVVSLIVTSWVLVETFPLASVAVHVTIVEPRLKTAGASLVMFTG